MPPLKLTVDVAVPPAVKVTGLGLKPAFRSGEVVGVTVADKVTEPANPAEDAGRLESVNVAVPAEPEPNVTDETLEVRLKSWTLTVKTMDLILVTPLSVLEPLVVTV